MALSFQRILNRVLALICLLPLLVSCSSGGQREEPKEESTQSLLADKLVREAEGAHGAEAWRRKGSLVGRIRVSVRGEKSYGGRLNLSTDLQTAQIKLDDGRSFSYAEGRWEPAEGLPSGEFSPLHIPYLASLPTSLSVAEARYDWIGLKTLKGDSLGAMRKTKSDESLKEEIIYQVPSSRVIKGVAPVSFAPGVEDAGNYAVTYEEFISVSGVKLPSRWKLWQWLPNNKRVGAGIGTVQLRNLRFTGGAANL